MARALSFNDFEDGGWHRNTRPQDPGWRADDMWDADWDEDDDDSEDSSWNEDDDDWKDWGDEEPDSSAQLDR